MSETINRTIEQSEDRLQGSIDLHAYTLARDKSDDYSYADNLNTALRETYLEVEDHKQRVIEEGNDTRAGVAARVMGKAALYNSKEGYTSFKDMVHEIALEENSARAADTKKLIFK